jgi:hypothetical protein
LKENKGSRVTKESKVIEAIKANAAKQVPVALMEHQDLLARKEILANAANKVNKDFKVLLELLARMEHRGNLDHKD